MKRTSNLVVVLYACSWGFSSDTFDSQYTTRLEDGETHLYIPGGRVVFFVLKFFFNHREVDFGHGYEAKKDMERRLT